MSSINLNYMILLLGAMQQEEHTVFFQATHLPNIRIDKIIITVLQAESQRVGVCVCVCSAMTDSPSMRLICSHRSVTLSVV